MTILFDIIFLNSTTYLNMYLLKQNSNKNNWKIIDRKWVLFQPVTLTCVIHDSLISINIGWKSFSTYFFFSLYLFRRYWKNLHWYFLNLTQEFFCHLYHEIADALLKKGSTPIVCQSRTCIYLGIPLTSLFLLLPDWGGWLPFPHSLSADFSPQDYAT